MGVCASLHRIPLFDGFKFVYGEVDMDELYSIHPSISCPNPTGFANHSSVDDDQMAVMELAETEVTGFEMSDIIKTQIANHPLYPNLVTAYIDCRQVGAPPEMASILEEVSKEIHPTISSCSNNVADPELDEFMTSYCEVLHRYKEELSKPFDEAKTFLNNIEFQLSNLCKDTLTSTTSSADDGGATSDEDISCELEATESQESHSTHQGDHELKEMLMRKYSGYLSNLRKDFLRKRRKGKLPKNARTVLIDWWNTHNKWPYPTEEDKNRLSEVTGLDQKQINNWFINQRKRHWRPSEDLRFALREGASNSTSESVYFDAAGGTGGIGT